jgi:hypothetical protein
MKSIVNALFSVNCVVDLMVFGVRSVIKLASTRTIFKNCPFKYRYYQNYQMKSAVHCVGTRLQFEASPGF